jgi:2-oxoglutarate ferredoxin oxidoreductase subunit delta
VEYCPKGVLAISTAFNAKGYYLPRLEHPEACTGCGLCERVCPDFAIYLVDKTEK